MIMAKFKNLIGRFALGGAPAVAGAAGAALMARRLGLGATAP